MFNHTTNSTPVKEITSKLLSNQLKKKLFLEKTSSTSISLDYNSDTYNLENPNNKLLVKINGLIYQTDSLSEKNL